MTTQTRVYQMTQESLKVYNWYCCMLNKFLVADITNIVMKYLAHSPLTLLTKPEIPEYELLSDVYNLNNFHNFNYNPEIAKKYVNGKFEYYRFYGLDGDKVDRLDCCFMFHRGHIWDYYETLSKFTSLEISKIFHTPYFGQFQTFVVSNTNLTDRNIDRAEVLKKNE